MGEKIPQVRLSNGMKIPVLGFGTYKMTEEKMRKILHGPSKWAIG